MSLHIKIPSLNVCSIVTMGVLCLSIVIPSQAMAALPVVEDIEITGRNGTFSVVFNFSVKTQYLSHIASSDNTVLQIQLRTVDPIPRDEFDPNVLESLSWAQQDSLKLLDIKYQIQDSGEGLLILRLKKAYQFNVQAQADALRLTVTIIDPDWKETVPPPKTEPAPPAPPKPQKITPVTPSLPPISTEKLKSLMEEARQTMAAKQYSLAARIYLKILNYPDHPYRQDAQEFLGVARERNGQLAHAKAEYSKYLLQYPTGEGAQRVKQRLVGLISAPKKPRGKLRTTLAPKRASEWDLFGGVSQFYRSDVNSTEQSSDEVTQSSLSTDLDFSARRRSEIFEIRTRFTGGYQHDFLDEGEDSATRISYLYFDGLARKLGLSMRLGRHSRRNGGVLGRFDGIHVGYQISPKIKFNTVAGYPVDSIEDSIDTERQLYGFSLDWGTFNKAWDFVSYAVQQQIHGIVDRQAVGGEMRYFKPGKSFFTSLDYDISYSQLNSAIMLGNWTFANKFSINTRFDYRNNPILTTSNALIGQPVDDIEQLLETMTEEEIRQLAIDRTGTSQTFTLGFNYPYSRRLQFTGDITTSSITGTVASGGVEAIPDTGNDVFYNLRFIGSNLLKEGDIAIIGIRYTDTSSADTISLNLDTRYPVNRKWRINPRIRFDLRNNANDNTNQLTIAPTLRTDYRWKRRHRIELDAGGQWSSLELANTDQGDTQQSSFYFLNIGYRLFF